MGVPRSPQDGLCQARLRRVRCDQARRVPYTAMRFRVQECVTGIRVALVPQGVRHCKVGAGKRIDQLSDVYS